MSIMFVPSNIIKKILRAFYYHERDRQKRYWHEWKIRPIMKRDALFQVAKDISVPLACVCPMWDSCLQRILVTGLSTCHSHLNIASTISACHSHVSTPTWIHICHSTPHLLPISDPLLTCTASHTTPNLLWRNTSYYISSSIKILLCHILSSVKALTSWLWNSALFR